MMKNITLLFVGMTFLFISAVYAVPVVTFEAGSAPGYTPSADLTITNQFAASHGVIFSTEVAPRAFVIERGSNVGVNAFCAPNCNNDSSSLSGQFMLFSGFFNSNGGEALIVDYLNPVSESFGDLIDIETSEAVTIQARDASNNVIDTVVMSGSSPGAGDGSIIQWQFNHAQADIHSVRITVNSAGWALDNISGSDTTVPEPSTVLSFLIFGVGTFFLRRK